jgi:hypothetical protein
MGVSFLTPLDALFALAAAIPLAALWVTQSNVRRIRGLFSLAPIGRRELTSVVGALALLPMLVGVAAAQPVVVRHRSLGERSDSQVFLVFDTTLSMAARKAPGDPSRLQRAIREAETILPKLGDIPVGVVGMTDRALPELMPTPDQGLVVRTLRLSVGINRPPPSEYYRGQVPILQSLFPIANSNLFNPGVRHPILVVFTDGETDPLQPGIGSVLARSMPVHPLFVHVWASGERLFGHGRLDAKYQPDPKSGEVLNQFARLSRGHVFEENALGDLVRTIRADAGNTPVRTSVLGYARVPLAPWFVLAGIIPLGFLLIRRNF